MARNSVASNKYLPAHFSRISSFYNKSRNLPASRKDDQSDLVGITISFTSVDHAVLDLEQ